MIKLIKKRRQSLNLTQQELSELSGLSLATIQNIEGARANPSLKVLSQIMVVLELHLNLEAKPFDWEKLGFFSGLLTLKKKFNPKELSRKNLSLFLRRASFEIQKNKKVDERILDSFEALLIALKTHYPSIYHKHEKLYNKLYPQKIKDRHIKLRRIALSYLGGYL